METGAKKKENIHTSLIKGRLKNFLAENFYYIKRFRKLMFNGIQNIFVSSLDIGQVIVNIFIAFMCGSIDSYMYRKTNPGPNFSVNYLNSLIILFMITSIVIMVIGNNFARAFDMVGAMSIIRFQTAA